MFYHTLSNLCCFSWELHSTKRFHIWLSGRISKRSVNTQSGIQLVEWRCSSTAVLISGYDPIPASGHFPLGAKTKEEFSWARMNLNTVKHVRICLTFHNIFHISSAPHVAAGLANVSSCLPGIFWWLFYSLKAPVPWETTEMGMWLWSKWLVCYS